MFKPHLTESETKELTFDSYVTYIHTHHCAACGRTETFSQCFEVWLHPTKTRTTNLRDLRPVTGTTLKPMNMAQLNVPPIKIPVCAGCVKDYKVVGKPETVTVQTTHDRWQETLRRKYEPTSTEPKVATKSAPAAKAVPSLDQI